MRHGVVSGLAWWAVSDGRWVVNGLLLDNVVPAAGDKRKAWPARNSRSRCQPAHLSSIHHRLLYRVHLFPASRIHQSLRWSTRSRLAYTVVALYASGAASNTSNHLQHAGKPKTRELLCTAADPRRTTLPALTRAASSEQRTQSSEDGTGQELFHLDGEWTACFFSFLLPCLALPWLRRTIYLFTTWAPLGRSRSGPLGRHSPSVPPCCRRPSPMHDVERTGSSILVPFGSPPASCRHGSFSCRSPHTTTHLQRARGCSDCLCVSVSCLRHIKRPKIPHRQSSPRPSRPGKPTRRRRCPSANLQRPTPSPSTAAYEVSPSTTTHHRPVSAVRRRHPLPSSALASRPVCLPVPVFLGVPVPDLRCAAHCRPAHLAPASARPHLAPTLHRCTLHAARCTPHHPTADPKGAFP